MEVAPGKISNAPLQVYLIRHGETDWTIANRHTGLTDLALTPRGEDESRDLAPWLRTVTFSAVFCSPAQRARRTCALAGLAAAAVIDPDLGEWNYGDYEGLSTVEIQQGRPVWNLWHDGCPHGESPGEVTVRADVLLERLHLLHGAVALFSHGQFGSALAARWVGFPVEAGQHFAVGPASLSILGHEPGHPLVPAIVLWNTSPRFP